MSNPQELLEVTVKEAEVAIEKACEIADKHGLSFDIMGQRYVGNNGKRLTIDDYWNGVYYDDLDEDDERFDPDYEYAGWQNSSTFC
jgi:hypothetical protein